MLIYKLTYIAVQSLSIEPEETNARFHLFATLSTELTFGWSAVRVISCSESLTSVFVTPNLPRHCRSAVLSLEAPLFSTLADAVANCCTS